MRDTVLERGFLWHVEVIDGATGQVRHDDKGFNKIPNAGRDFLAQSPFGAVSPITDFYVGLFDQNYIPSAAALSSDLPNTVGEFLGYSEATRPAWERVYDDATGTHSNEASRAVFTVTVERRVYGLFMNSSSGKGTDTGLLLSVMRLPTPRDLKVGDVVRAAAGIIYVPTEIS